MTQRLVWNFEFTRTKKHSSHDLKDQCEEDLKWEARFFWPEEHIINLALLDDSLIDLAQYQQKQKKDHYYLVPDQNYNIKFRRDELFYKPLVKQGKYAHGFGAKINLSEFDQQECPDPELKNTIRQIVLDIKNAKEVVVKKDSFTYKFPVHPHIKLELSRLEVDELIYFSACIEGKSRTLVETLSKRLLGKQTSCDYISFLKKVT
jgi:hypothetical protein